MSVTTTQVDLSTPMSLTQDPALAVTKLFVYPFHAAPTADLVALGVAALNDGATAGDIVDFLLAAPVAGAPLPDITSGSSNLGFVTALVEGYTWGTSVSASTKAAWVQALLPDLVASSSRGSFVAWLNDAIDGYDGTDADLVSVKAALADRMTMALAYQGTAAGAVYDGGGWTELTAVLDVLLPDPATYTLVASATSVDEGSTITFSLATTHVEPGTLLPYTISGNGITAEDFTSGSLTGQFLVRSNGLATITLTLAADAVTEGPETLVLTLGDGLASRSVLINDTSLAPPPPPTFAVTASDTTVDEGGSITYTLLTTGLAAGAQVAYTLSGTGITDADIVGSQLAGNFTVGADGRASLTITVRADGLTEGNEVLRLSLDGTAHEVLTTIVDTSVGQPPPPEPTFVLTASTAAVDEGGSITYTLLTTGLAAGVQVTYTLSGSGITESDIVGGQLGGIFTIGADGSASVSVTVRADSSTEGDEVLRLSLDGKPQEVLTTIRDTSVSTGPVGTPDTLVIADNMNNPLATVPANAAEGELQIDTYLTYDLLDQSQNGASRMTLEQLRATNPTAGAALDATNSSADRGNIPQVSNQGLYTFDLGLMTDRIDYSAETGRIVAVVSGTAPANLMHVIVNDNGVDDVYDDATDRIDTLLNIEEVVASGGGGVLDLSNAGRALELRFSHNFNPAVDVVTELDRAVHTLRVADLVSGNSLGRSYIEYRDAGASATTQANAVWTQIQGSDHAETLVFTSHESGDDRLMVLRGGNNAVKYNELTRSILVDVEMLAWNASTNAADDSNASGIVRVSTQFTNGDGITLLSPATHVSTSHMPDNRIAAGSLWVAGTQDSEDAVRFDGSPGNKVITIGETAGVRHVTARLADSPTAAALDLTGFEIVIDNGTSDDLYVIDNITSVANNGPALVDGGAGDHDAIALTNNAVGKVEVGGIANTILLATLNSPAGLDFDFDVLDIRAITQGNLTLAGTAGGDDELVLGDPRLVSSTTQFEALVLSQASLVAGTSYTLDLDTAQLRAGNTPLFGHVGTVLSAGGLVYGGLGLIAAVQGDLSLTLIDTSAGAGGTLWGGNGDDSLTGGAGDDTLRGGSGDDTLTGNGGADTFVFEATGAANGSDTVRDFTPGSDKLDVTAFTGGAITAAAASINGQLGGSFTGVATTAEFIFNRVGASLTAADFATAPAAGKFVLADGAHQVVAVTADPTGAQGDATVTPVLLYYVVNGSTPGLSDLTVSLVGTIESAGEATLAQIYAALS